jgi:hypothetical protein
VERERHSPEPGQLSEIQIFRQQLRPMPQGVKA